MDEIYFTNKKLVENRLSTNVVVPSKYRKYLLSSSMFLQYDSKILADESILNIPLITTMLPLAWLTGINIYVDRLDKNFKVSIDLLEKDFKKMYPELRTDLNVKAGELVENKINIDDSERRTALLFSGGVDSTYSMITNLDLKPKLVMIWGIDGYPYPKASEYWSNVISTYSELAENKGLELHIVKTDTRRVLHSRRIGHDFHRELLDGTLWVRLQFALFMLPLIAPLSIGRFDSLMLAAGHDPSYSFVEGPEAIEPIVPKIYWASLRSKLDGFIPRYDKILKLKEVAQNEALKLRVCQSHKILGTNKLNCSSCEKCYRTIIPLVINKIDPNNCGFNVNETTYQNMKAYFTNRNIPMLHIEDQWRSIQHMIPEQIDSDFLSSTEFLEWFKDHDLSNTEKDVWFYLNIYNKLPWPISKVLDEIYKMNNIHIHDHSPTRLKGEKKISRSSEKE